MTFHLTALVTVCALLLAAAVAGACMEDGRLRDHASAEGDSTLVAAGSEYPSKTPCAPGQTDRFCNSATEVCVKSGPYGPHEFWSCVPVPEGCERDRTCACLGERVCRKHTPLSRCGDSPHPNTIICESGYQ